MAILMTEQLAQQLIEHYEQCIKTVKSSRSVKEAIKHCYGYCTEAGICLTSTQMFAKEIYNCDWVNSIPKTAGSYIIVTPSMCINIPDIITALQTRVDILKTFKNQ